MASKAPYEVGYGKPPNETQFKKGKSGNPNGRPKKAHLKPAPLHPATFPTRKLTREEAGRMVPVREGDRLTHMQTTQAVLRSLSMAAMKGGVLAQRTYLNYVTAEDERYRKERREAFDFWERARDRNQSLIDKAAARGEPCPDPVPHPEDMVFNYATYDVRFLGAIDEEEKQQQDLKLALRDLYLELSLYFNEQPMTKGLDGNVGSHAFLFCVACQLNLGLPSRLCWRDTLFGPALRARCMGPRKDWEFHLKERCDALRFPFAPRSRNRPAPFRHVLNNLGLTVKDGTLVNWRPQA